MAAGEWGFIGAEIEVCFAQKEVLFVCIPKLLRTWSIMTAT